MATATTPGLAGLSPETRIIQEHWNALLRTRRNYTLLSVLILLVALSASLWFANETNAGKFFDRLPHLFDFFYDFIPRETMEVVRALFDLPSPYADGSFKYDYPEGRRYITDTIYMPEYMYLMLETINIAIASTLISFFIAFGACFFAAKNLMPNPWVRFAVRRVMEIFRAFPEIVIAGFFLAVFALGPIPALIAITIHTIGANGKLFFEVVENADMKAEEGLRAAGGNWLERVRFAIVPQVLPNFLSYALLRLEINVRASTIIGAVGGGGIGEQLRLSIGRSHESKTVAIILLLLVTIVAIDQFSAYLRRRIVGDQAFESMR